MPQSPTQIAQARQAAEQIAQQGLPLDRSLGQLLDALNLRTAQVQQLLQIIDGLTRTDEGAG